MSDFEWKSLVNSLKELVIHLGPILHESASLEEAEEHIVHLEESDSNFHKYDYVKKLRAKIEAVLGDLIDEEIDRHSIHPNDASAGMETVVSSITDRVLHSKEYTSLTSELQQNVGDACQYLLQNFRSEFVEGQQHAAATSKNQRRKRQSEVIFSSDGDSSYSLNQSSFMFMNSDVFRTTAEELDKRQPVEVRRDALRKLSQIHTIDDVLNYDSWSLMRQGLQDALADQDHQIWTHSLKFIARGFSSTSQHTKEIYCTLLEYMSMQFHTSKSTIPKVSDGIDTTREENEKLLKAFRLMNEFQLQIPQYWVRYSEKFLDDIVDATFSLLSINHSTSVSPTSQMNPVHFLALVDPQANWFIKWMHGHYSRAPLLKALKRHRIIVDHAVKSCLDYVSSEQGRSVILGHEQAVYGAMELDFVYFIHSLHVLGSLLCHKQGRSFFPVKVKDIEGSVTVTKLLVSLIELVTEPSVNRETTAPRFEPCSLVFTQVLKKVCASEQTCQTCMCNDAVTNALLKPIKKLLGQDTGSSFASEKTLLQVADILAMIASTSCGRTHLMYGDESGKSKTSPVHILCEFSKRALNENLVTKHGPLPSKAAIGNYIFVCRQLYNTCEGYQVLSEYKLHEAIATAWKIASREADNAATPTPSLEGRESDRDAQYIVLWEDTLRDNLLNFAGTPNGVLLLEQTGAMNDCVSYMHSRYERKLQVSKCEKFGYGFMMSQVAATAPGMVALHQTGFLTGQIMKLWGALEVNDDSPVYSPKSWPVLPIDKYTKKLFTNFSNLLSSYCAVYELLGDMKLPTKEEYSLREMPDSLAGLIDRIILVDSDVKMHALFNYEQSHVFGLRLLSVLTSCMDTCLLLQTQYDFQGKLLTEQSSNVVEGSANILVDMLSLERNFILVKSYVIGGPSERLLPERTLDASNTFSKILFSSFPVPQGYIPKTAKSSMKQENELSKFLTDSKKASLNSAWLEKCRRSLCSALTAKPDQALRGNVLQDLLDKCASALMKVPEEAIFPFADVTGSESNVKSVKLTSFQQTGIAMAVRYGLQLKLLSSSKDATENLKALHKQCNHFLQQQQRSSSMSPLYSMKMNHCGFDWFICTVFLIMGGNKDKAWKLLHKLSALVVSAYVWKHRLHASVHLPQNLMASGIPLIFSKTCHNIELILQTEVPHVYSAFKMSGYTPGQICQQWLRQCFWNYLDWQELCHYICVCIVLGIDYQVYLCVAVLKFLQTQILQQTQEKDLIVFLKEEPIRGFKVGEHLEYMQQLESKFRRTVLKDMLTITKA